MLEHMPGPGQGRSTTKGFLFYVLTFLLLSIRNETRAGNSSLFFNFDHNVGIAQAAFHYKSHYVEALLLGCYSVEINSILVTGFQLREFHSGCYIGQRISTVEFEIESRAHCLGSGVDNCPLNIERIVWTENRIINRSATDDVTGILWFGSGASTASTCSTGNRR